MEKEVLVIYIASSLIFEGEVWRGELKGDEVAIKRLQNFDNIEITKELGLLRLVTNTQFTHQIRSMKHQGVIGFKQYLKEIGVVVMEYASNGNLSGYLKSRAEPIGNGLDILILMVRLVSTIEVGFTISKNHLFLAQSRSCSPRFKKCQHTGNYYLILLKLKISKSLDIKVSDFGVSYWTALEGVVPHPKFYVGGKDMYNTIEGDDTIKPFVDIRCGVF